MQKTDLAKKAFPQSPGVYFFLGKKREILYIGKATSLKNRIQSYFSTELKEKRSALIEKMVAEAKTVEYQTTDSVLEALLLEVNLIRTHKPYYNTRSKDDKSYNHLVITNETFPRVLVVRGKDLTEKFNEADAKYIYGPFPNGTLFREALQIIRKLFQFYDIEKPLEKSTSKMARGKIDFNRQIGLYPDVQTKQEYARTIRHIRLFFEGKKQTILKELEKEMMRYAKNEEFEKAHVLKQKIFALKHIQDVSLVKDESRTYQDDKTIRIEAYDIAHLGGDSMVGVLVVFSGTQPRKDLYRKFIIKTVSGPNDTAALHEVLERRFAHSEWPTPDIVVVDGSIAQKNTAEKVLQKLGIVVPVVGVVKDEKHNPLRIIGSKSVVDTHHNTILYVNAEAHRFAISFHRQKLRKRLV